jgi:2-hydroxychromene-2-carboxylate isomerase
MPELECFFDCSSPWTYFAFESLLRMQDEIAVTIRWRPFLVGGVFNAVNPSVYNTGVRFADLGSPITGG